MNLLHKAITEKRFIEGLIPQKNPFVMVDKLFHFSDKKVISGFTIPSTNLLDRKSTRLNSSHVRISYAVFCLKKKSFIGTVGHQRKNYLMSSALWLLVPSLVSETSTLVAMESPACGTPVVAFRRSAPPALLHA